MNRMTALAITAATAVVVALGLGIALAVVVADDDTPGWMGPGMGWDDSWGPMMGGSRSGNEPDYLVEMVAHHEEAVTAARELERSDRAEMRRLGTSIVRSQSAEITQMKAWLKDWYPDQSDRPRSRPMMRDLSGLSGDRLDRAFLQDMIGHHMVAVMMSQHLLWRGADHEEVTDLARSIRDDQRAEIIQMQRWLAQWFDIDWHPGMTMNPGAMMGAP
jgi:uncharacterized protein (DUF305 family)